MNTQLHAATRVCFFAHFDSEGHVQDYVIRYLKQLRLLDFVIIFVTPTPIGDNAKNSLLEICHDVILRKNEGLDFGSWAAAFSKYGHELTGDLLLANDSVYGPIGDLQAPLERLLDNDADFFGLVESLDTAQHLQSWFLIFKPHVYRSREFQSIMSLPFARLSKREIIELAEVGLTTTLIRAGFRYSAAYQASKAGALSRLHPFNPSHFLWRELVTSGRVPYIKVELLRDNPVNVPDVHSWQSVVAQIEPEIVPMMKAHLERKNAVSLLTHDGRSSYRTLKARLQPQAFFARDYLYASNQMTAAMLSNAIAFLAFLPVRKIAIAALKVLRKSRLKRQRA